MKYSTYALKFILSPSATSTLFVFVCIKYSPAIIGSIVSLSSLFPNCPCPPCPNPHTVPSFFTTVVVPYPAVTPIKSDTFVFSFAFLTSTSPSNPCSLLVFIPIVYSFPSFVNIAVYLSPAYASTTFSSIFSASILAWVTIFPVLLTVVPSPNCPKLLFPIPYTVPSSVTNTPWSYPSDMLIIFGALSPESSFDVPSVSNSVSSFMLITAPAVLIVYLYAFPSLSIK